MLAGADCITGHDVLWHAGWVGCSRDPGALDARVVSAAVHPWPRAAARHDRGSHTGGLTVQLRG